MSYATQAVASQQPSSTVQPKNAAASATQADAAIEFDKV